MKLAGLSLFVFVLMSFRGPVDPAREQFRRNFPGAGNVSWLEENDFLYVRFEDHGQACMAWYEYDGQLLRTQRYFDDATLPAFPRARISARYPNKKVHSAIEVFQKDNGVFWLVRLEDEKHWFVAKVDAEGDVYLMEKYRKA